MRRRDSLRAWCLAVLLLAPWPQAAEAASGSLFLKQICAEMTDIPGLYGFETNFVGAPNCQKLCAQAVVTCERAVKDATSCQLAFSSDWVTFDTAVTCAGLTGGDLRDCKASWANDKKDWQALIKQERSIALAGCLQHLQLCQLRCTGQ
jgi:hypothetical protein